MHLNVPIFSTILKHFVWRFIFSNSSFLCGYTALIGSMPRLLWLVYCILCMLVAEHSKDPNNKGRPICVSQTQTWSTDKSLQIVNHRIAPSFIMSPSNKNDRHSILIDTFLDNSGATADYQNYNVSLPRPTECVHNTTQHNTCCTFNRRSKLVQTNWALTHISRKTGLWILRWNRRD